MRTIFSSLGIAVLLSAVAHATISTSITYNIVDPVSPNMTLSGTITTNGDIGANFDFNMMPTGDIMSFSIDVTYTEPGSGDVHTYNLNNVDHEIIKDDAAATMTDLTIGATGITIRPSASVFAPRIIYDATPQVLVNDLGQDPLVVPMPSSVFATTTAIPEPSAFLLLGLVGMGIVSKRYWKNRKADD